MKATFSNGITAEGTPKEVAEFKRLMDEQGATYKPVNPPYQTGTFPWWLTKTTTTGSITYSYL